jgi:triosephosphate isomerase
MARLIIGNWKMNLGPGEAVRLLEKVQNKIEAKSGTEVVVCPPVIDLTLAVTKLDDTKVKLGAQNLHWADHGPYTGEVSGEMLRGLAEYVLVGHSERRAMGEDDQIIAKKMAAAIRNGLTPVLCVGEKTIDREHGHAARVVVDQLNTDLADLTEEDMAKVVVAYEPVWAIGTGRFATPDEIRPVIKAIHSTLEELYGAHGSAAPVLYGGSVAPDNCMAYLKMPGIDGLLAGGVSLNPEEFGAIVAAAQSL